MSEPTKDGVRETLTYLWSEILNVVPAEDDDFFDIGGGSMELVMLLIAINDRFGESMSIDEIFPDAFTFGTSVRAVSAAIGADAGKAV